ncbi:AraC family transcriptional regulator [Arenimonas donghaensis]|uniref:HTH araC/xylS-type domain-containing protein n=1 Tax=Arenimonas donghaensis DSM 18148 = HO3-R19 TaxID=1121014 RepID=A0A087MJ50_9GAMM|nr:AraC family transcriptional regulator [Arenimonas donghaensis]KFL36903.1 hypothetical protein N788_12305 [Arenimonas donghaensis DSM 18148 = HO3-R19]
MPTPSAPVDRLQGLLQRFSVSARMFHSGPLCGINDFDDIGLGQLHLVRRGPLTVRHEGEELRVEQPSLLFYPRPLAHRFIADATTGADMACANLDFSGGAANPITRALPAFVALPLSALPQAPPLLDLLFDEAFAQRCGRQVLVDRLFEAVLVLLLRYLLDSGQVRSGPLAGLGHPQLAKALTAMHEAPASAWTLESLAAVAGMSRSRFAEVFAERVGTPPSNYLAGYRITLAQDALRRGDKLDRVAQQVGYGSAASLSRAFSAACGLSPRQWLKDEQAG